MNIFQALILGIVQGVTEFLPISSSAHLIIFPYILGWQVQSLAFDTTLHLGTAFALIYFFYKDLKDIVLSLVKDIPRLKKNIKEYSKDSKLGLSILIGSVPAGILGLIFGDFIEESFRGIVSVVIFLTLGSILLYSSEFFSNLIKKSNSITYKKSILIGLFQVLALFPGVSRSGSTISGGMLLGLSREEAARFSFLLSVPIVITAGVFKLVSLVISSQYVSYAPLFIGFLSSFLVGVLSIKFLLKFLRSNKLYPFVLYRVILAAVLMFFV